MLVKQMSQEQIGQADDLKFKNVNISLAKKNLTRMKLDPTYTLDAGQQQAKPGTHN